MPASSKLGHYELHAELGRGGSGVVYDSFDTRLQRRVALKILNQSDSEARPLREIRAASLLDHPGIARIYETGEDSGRRFIAMELVPGKTLAEVLSKGTLNLATALDYACQILQALEAAHTAGVVHRDLKPSNLMITPEGNVKIVDFGVAKVTSPLQTTEELTSSWHWQELTREGSLTGTLAYISPEQAEAKPVDARADIFSFGAVLYEMLSGRMVFGRESQVATLVAVMSQDPAPIPSLPGPLWSVLSRCLQKDARERWHSAADLRFALEEGGNRLPEPPPERDRRSTRRQVLLWGVAGAVASASAFFLGRHTAAAPGVPSFEQLTFTAGEILVAKLSPDGASAYLAFRYPGRSAFEIVETHFGTRAMRSLGLPAGYPAATSPNGELAVILTDEFPPGVLARASRDGGPVKALAEGAYHASFGPDGKALMAVRRIGARDRIEYPLGTVIAEEDAARGSTFHYATLSRDGKKIAFFRPEADSRAEELCVMDLDAPSRPVRTLAGGWTITTPLHWAPGDTEVWVSGAKAGKHAGIWACELAGRERRLIEIPVQLTLQDIRPKDRAALAVLHESRTSVRVLMPSKDKETELNGLTEIVLQGISDDGRVFLACEPVPEIDSGLPMFVFTAGNVSPIRVAEGRKASLSCDGKHVAVQPAGARDSRLLIVAVGPGEEKDVSKPGFRYESTKWFSDGERLLVTGNEEGQDKRSFILSLKDRSHIPVTPPGTWGLVVSRDGERLLLTNGPGDLILMELAAKQIRTIGSYRSMGFPLTWHVDGKSILFADKQESTSGIVITRVDLGSGRKTQALTLNAERGAVGYPVITPDGRYYGYGQRETSSTLYLVHGLG